MHQVQQVPQPLSEPGPESETPSHLGEFSESDWVLIFVPSLTCAAMVVLLVFSFSVFKKLKLFGRSGSEATPAAGTVVGVA